MAPGKCGKCGGDLVPNAAFCVQCGSPAPRGASIGKKVAIACVGVFGLCFIGPCLLGTLGSRGRGVEAQARASARSTEAPRPVDIGTLLGEYGSNEVRADATFKGHIIQTTGVVSNVGKDLLDTIYVTLGTGQRYEPRTVQCFFDNVHAKRVASLSKGDHVTVRGRVDGLMMNVQMKDCEFVGM